MRRSCSVCTVAGTLEAGETAMLRKLMGDLQDVLAQVTRVMAAMANGVWSGHTTPLETASSVDSDSTPCNFWLTPGVSSGR